MIALVCCRCFHQGEGPRRGLLRALWKLHKGSLTALVTSYVGTGPDTSTGEKEWQTTRHNCNNLMTAKRLWGKCRTGTRSSHTGNQTESFVLNSQCLTHSWRDFWDTTLPLVYHIPETTSIMMPRILAMGEWDNSPTPSPQYITQTTHSSEAIRW